MAATMKQTSLVNDTWQDCSPSIEPIKSPLRYPGGKSRAVKRILDMLPPGLKKLCAPFVGGGSVELALATRRVEVRAYDAFLPLVNFWQALLRDPSGLADLVDEYYPLSKDAFYALQKKHIHTEESEKSAAEFFVLNRSSFSGTTLSGGMSPGHPRFTKSAINRLTNFKVNDFYVEHADFKQSIPRHAEYFLYLDPPYFVPSNLYGQRGDHHKNFDHEGLAKLLHRRDQWLLSYNDCEQVRNLYSEFRFISTHWTYGMNTSKKSNEIFVVSHDYIEPNH